MPVNWKDPDAFTRLLAAMVAAQDMKVSFAMLQIYIVYQLHPFCRFDLLCPAHVFLYPSPSLVLAYRLCSQSQSPQSCPFVVASDLFKLYLWVWHRSSLFILAFLSPEKIGLYCEMFTDIALKARLPQDCYDVWQRCHLRFH